MKILSVKQPWAWLFFAPELAAEKRKDVENRIWYTNYRGPLLIHASKKFDWDGFISLREEWPEIGELVINHFDIRVGCGTNNYSHLGVYAGEVGGIVGMVHLDRIEEDSKSRWAAPGHYHWMVSNARKLPFTPCPGKLKLWEDAELVRWLGLVA